MQYMFCVYMYVYLTGKYICINKIQAETVMS